MKCTNANKMLLDLKRCLEEYVNIENEELLYDNNESNEYLNEEDLVDKKDDKRYLTDQTIPYPLSEKLANTTPCKFSYKKITYDISSYKDLWIKLCEILYEKDNKRFDNIAKLKKLSGKKIPYITYKNDEAVKDIKDVASRFTQFLDTDIILYINMSVPQNIKLIEELLDMYKISTSSIKVYLKNDRNPKSGYYPVGKYLDDSFDYDTIIKEKQNIVEQNDTRDKPKVKISQRAYDYFQEYFKNTNQYYNIHNFLDKDWCYKTFNVHYPILKQVDNTLPLKEQTYTEDKNYAHYNQSRQIIINDKCYMIYMRWIENQHRSKLEEWISKNPLSNLLKESEQKINVFILPKNRIKICGKCGNKTQMDKLLVTYYKENEDFQHMLHIRKCNNCNLVYMSDGTLRMYKNTSDKIDPSINFIEKDT